ncbi:hypothetical protein SSX86_018423 [Deinandra increscens subsp. villosa]|uniref:Uncharacterized protein n=1 Tax=Deinandra increscens subsp. villosa TaxID=3103831 RepID=A0AAP0GS50_9ASTR
MNPESVEQKINDDCNEDEDDALSLRDLQMYDQTSTHSSPRSTCFSAQELFEFFPTHPTSATLVGDHNNNNNIMFFGKVINPHSSGDYNDDRYQNDLRGGSSSFRLPERRPTEHVIPTFRSVSNRGLGSPRHGVKSSSSSVKKVNFTALTSKSKRRLFLFGPVPPEMEMSSIRERQGRRAPPSRMFPVAAEGGGGGGLRKAVTGTDKNTTVRCRSRLNSVFERSVSCLRM